MHFVRITNETNDDSVFEYRLSPPFGRLPKKIEAQAETTLLLRFRTDFGPGWSGESVISKIALSRGRGAIRTSTFMMRARGEMAK